MTSAAARSSTANIVHESETQRQYVRLNMPARAVIADKTYAIRDLSAAGMGLTGFEEPLNKGQRFDFQLVLPFDAFSLDIRLEAEVQYADLAEKRLGCRFVNLTDDKVSILTRIIKSFIAGEVITEGDILNVAARDNFVKVRKSAAPAANKDSKFSIVQQLLPLGLVVALGLAAFYVIGMNVYQNSFLLQTSQAFVAASEVSVKAQTAALYTSALDSKARSVKKGQILAQSSTFNPVTGSNVQIVSPCDCSIQDNQVVDGAFVASGETLFTLVPLNAKPWVYVTVDSKDAFRLKVGGKAHISIAGSELPIEGAIESIKSLETIPVPGSAPGGIMARLKIVPDGQIPIDLINRPANVEFHF